MICKHWHWDLATHLSGSEKLVMTLKQYIKRNSILYNYSLPWQLHPGICTFKKSFIGAGELAKQVRAFATFTETGIQILAFTQWLTNICNSYSRDSDDLFCGHRHPCKQTLIHMKTNKNPSIANQSFYSYTFILNVILSTYSFLCFFFYGQFVFTINS